MRQQRIDLDFNVSDEMGTFSLIDRSPRMTTIFLAWLQSIYGWQLHLMTFIQRD